VKSMLKQVIRLIRSRYSKNVPIIICMDGGFFDQDLFEGLDKQDVGFVSNAKKFTWTRKYVGGVLAHENEIKEFWQVYRDGNREYRYLEFGYRCQPWDYFLRAFYVRKSYKLMEQMEFEFAKDETIILTNIGVNPKIFEGAEEIVKALCETNEYIIWIRR